MALHGVLHLRREELCLAFRADCLQSAKNTAVLCGVDILFACRALDHRQFHTYRDRLYFLVVPIHMHARRVTSMAYRDDGRTLRSWRWSSLPAHTKRPEWGQ